MDPLHAYTLRIVELGQRTLALQRQGQRLPEELMALAAELLALDAELRQRAIASPEAVWVAGRGSVVSPASHPSEDDMMVLGEDEIDSSPAFIYEPLNVPPPLVIDVPPVPAEGVVAETASADAEPPVLPATSPPGGDGHSAAQPRFCGRCGETLRPGKRFCHRCGAPA